VHQWVSLIKAVTWRRARLSYNGQFVADNTVPMSEWLIKTVNDHLCTESFIHLNIALHKKTAKLSIVRVNCLMMFQFNCCIH